MARWAYVHFQAEAMTNEITVDVTEWERFALLLDKKSADLLDKHMTNAMDGSLDWLLDQITAETPVNFGLLRASFGKEIHGTAFDLVGIVGTPLVYGLPVETGRAPGKMPPIAPIKLWVVRKLGLKGKAADQAAWAIAYNIGKKGTKGAFMVEQAYNQAVSGPEIEKIWSYELEKFLQELAR